ncbi:MAG: ABC transporter ATP-binding protein [Thermoanaerobaculia bacterium]
MSATSSSPAIFRTRGLARTYRLGETEIRALDGVDLEIAAGELVILAGPSGSGKSTLLHLLGALDGPDAGSVEFDGTPLGRLGERERTLLRRRRLGFIFQSFHLVPVLTAAENVEYPLWIDEVPHGERKERALAMLDAVGLATRAGHRPERLSGGERQRVAIARALVHRPLAVLADEPTGNLDSRNAAQIFDLLARLQQERGTTVVVATHDPAIIARGRRRIDLLDGRIVADRATGAAS